MTLLIAAAICFTACSKDDDNNGTDNPSVEIPPVIDELDIFRDRVITVDAQGNLMGVNVGTAFDDEEPTVFSTQVSDMNDAKNKFMELVGDFKHVSATGNDITVSLEDAEGKEQGKVIFSEGSGDEVAAMTYEGFTLPGITMLKYMLRLPESNATSRWKLWEVVTVPSSAESNPRGLCIREYSPGTNGMIICPTSYESGYQSWRANSSVPTLKQMAAQVQKLGVSEVSKRLEQAGLYSDLTKYYWSNYTKWYGLDTGHWKVRLSDGDDIYVSAWEVGLNKNNANNCYTYWFDEKGKCW